MIFYVTCRALRFRDQVVSPKETLKYSFQGLPFTFECIASNIQKDGRWLYKIVINESDPIKAEEYKAVILEGLTMFGVHEKTEAKALEFRDYING